MKGVGNEGFEDDAKSSQVVTAENELELKDQKFKSDVLLKFENLKPEPDTVNKINLENANPVVRIILKIRAWLSKCFFEENKWTKVFWITSLHAAALAYLIATIIRYRDLGFPPIEWCNGVGFLWIVYFLVYLHLSYSLCKKFIGKQIDKISKPIFKEIEVLKSKKIFRWFCFIAPVVALAAFVIIKPGKTGRRIYSFGGIIGFIIFGFIFSKYPGHIKWRPVICGIVLQFLFGILSTRWELGRNILDCLGQKVIVFLEYTDHGSRFVYGALARPEDNSAPIFAFSVIPVIYFLSFFINILSYYGSLQWVIKKLSWIVKLVMGTTVCESVSAVASIFLGQSESPLLIKSYIKDLTKSEICAIMCTGWSTVAGSVMAAYIGFGVKPSHLIAASIMSAPAALSYSKLFYPETEESKNKLDNIILDREKATNALDAASKGASSAVVLITCIIANLIAFLAFIAFLDGTLGWIGLMVGFPSLSFQYIISKVFIPVAFLMGIEGDNLESVALLVGIKTVANEFQAYKMLGELIKLNKLSERSEIIATYALCGFSNFSSIGITIGALTSIEPRQRSTITEVAGYAFVAANIVCFMTACVAGCLIE